MSEKNAENLSLDDILDKMGVDKSIIEKHAKQKQIKETPKPPVVSSEPVNVIGNIDEVVEENDEISPKTLSKMAKSKAKNYRKKSLALFVLFAISLYLSVSPVFSLPIISFLKYTQNPYTVILVNIVLLIISLILSVDIICDGIKNIIKPNLDTLIAFCSFSALLYLLSIVYFENALGYLPFTAITILILTTRIKSFENLAKSSSYTYNICSMSSNIHYVTNNNSSKSGFITRNKYPDTSIFSKETAEHSPHYLISIYCAVAIIYVVGFSIYASNGNVNELFFYISALSTVLIPINFINGFSLPVKIISKKLFNDGIAIKSYNDVSKISKNSSIVLNDNDIFSDKTIYIEGFRLYSIYTEREILAYVSSVFTKLNLSAKQAFDRELKARLITPYEASNIETFDTGGMTFDVDNKKVSIGSSEFITKIGLKITQGRNIQNPIYVVIDGKIVAIFALKYMATPSMYNLISNLLDKKIKIIIATQDFNITPAMLKKLFDIDENLIIFPDLAKREILQKPAQNNENYILISRHTGSSYINSVISARKLVNVTRINIFIGALCLVFGISIASYLVYLFRPDILLPHNILLFLLAWSIPSYFISWSVK